MCTGWHLIPWSSVFVPRVDLWLLVVTGVWVSMVMKQDSIDVCYPDVQLRWISMIPMILMIKWLMMMIIVVIIAIVMVCGHGHSDSTIASQHYHQHLHCNPPSLLSLIIHDDVIKWKLFPHNWPFVRGIHTGPGEFPTQRPVTRSFDVFFDLLLNKRLSKQPWGWWFETLSWSLWRHYNVIRITSSKRNKQHMNTSF